MRDVLCNLISFLIACDVACDAVPCHACLHGLVKSSSYFTIRSIMAILEILEIGNADDGTLTHHDSKYTI